MFERFMYLALVIVSGLLAGVGDTLLNHWAKTANKIGWLLGGLFILVVSLVLFAFSLKRGFLAEYVVIFIVADALFVAIVSLFFLHEAISVTQWFWLTVALIAVIMMELSA